MVSSGLRDILAIKIWIIMMIFFREEHYFSILTVYSCWCLVWWQLLLNHPVDDFTMDSISHDDVIKWKHFPRYWPFVPGIHRPPVNFPHKGQWRGTLMFSLICVWINGWVNNREAGDLRCYRAHYDVIVMNGRTDLICKKRSSVTVILRLFLLIYYAW